MLAWAKCDGSGTGENCLTVGSTGVAGSWTANIATAQAGITAAKNAVNTNPTGGQIYVQSNSGDFGRSAGYGLASPLAFGNQTAVAPTSLNVTTSALISTGTQITQANLLGYELAAAGPDTASVSTPTMIAPGSAYFLARTSSSGMLAGGFQTPATWYLLKGAVFSAGLINEPYGLMSIRYPEMMLFQSRYTRGATAIEAAWASTRDPWETIFVGDPLASPFSVSAPAPVPTRQVVFMRGAAPAPQLITAAAIPAAGTNVLAYSHLNVFDLSAAGPTDWKKWVATANDTSVVSNTYYVNAADITLRKTAATQRISDMSFTGVTGFQFSRFASNAFFDFSVADNDLSGVDYSSSYFLQLGYCCQRPHGSSYPIANCAPGGTLIPNCTQSFTVATGSTVPQNLNVWTHADSLNAQVTVTDGTITSTYTTPAAASPVVDERVLTIPLTPASSSTVYTVKLTALSTQPTATKGEIGIMAAALGGSTPGNVADAVLATPGQIDAGITTLGVRVHQADPSVRIPAATVSTTLTLGADLQTAINSAACGTDIHLPLGYVSQRSSTIILPNKGCTDSAWIRIIADGAHNVFGQRAIPADYPGGAGSPAMLAISNALPVVSNDMNNSNPALRAAHHYALVGVEITTAGETGTLNYNLVRFSNGGYVGSNPTLASISHDIIIQGIYLHRHSTLTNSLNGMEFNVDRGAIYDSYIAGFQNDFMSESHAFYLDSANGPLTFRNNYLSATTECVIFGGVIAAPYVVTKDIEFDGNFFDKPASLNTQPYPPFDVKNLLEFKEGQYVSVTNNVFEHSFSGYGQPGQSVFIRSVNFGTTQKRSTSNYLVQNNIFRHDNIGVQIEAFDGYAMGRTNNGVEPTKIPKHYVSISHDILIRNNSFEDLSVVKWGALNRGFGPVGSDLFYISSLPFNLTIDHNTGSFDSATDNAAGYQDNDHSFFISNLSMLNAADTLAMGYTATLSTAPDGAASTFVFTNNILNGGIHGDSNYGTLLFPSAATYTNNSFFNVPGYINNTFTSKPIGTTTTSTTSTTMPVVVNQGVNPATLPNDCTVITGNRSDVSCTPGQ